MSITRCFATASEQPAQAPAAPPPSFRTEKHLRMNARTNPFSPGYGLPPPEFVGFGSLLAQSRHVLQRVSAGQHSRGIFFQGLHGAGKSVLLDRVRRDGEAQGLMTVRMEVLGERSLPALLSSGLKQHLRNSNLQPTAAKAVRQILSAFDQKQSVHARKKRDYEHIDAGAEENGPDTLSSDLFDLITSIVDAAVLGHSSLVLFIDDLEHMRVDHLRALFACMNMIAAERLPITLFASGLPQSLGQSDRFRPYAEPPIDFLLVDALSETEVEGALNRPGSGNGVLFEKEAVSYIATQTGGHAYFVQQWGKEAWSGSQRDVIGLVETRQATAGALAALDKNFFMKRFERLTEVEQRYLRDMAGLGEGPHRSGDVAEASGLSVTRLAPIRNALIRKAMIYSPSYGATAFAMPRFHEFIQRTFE